MNRKRITYIIILAFWLLHLLILPTVAQTGHSLHKKILIMGDYGAAPYEYTDKNGKANGYNVELITALMEELGLDYEIRLGEWSKVIQKFKDGEIDVITGVADLPERNLPALFSIPIDYVYNNIIVRQDSDIESYDDLAGKEIIVQSNDKMDEYFKTHLISNKIIRVANGDEGMQVLAEGKHDAVIYPEKIAANLMARNKEYRHLKVIPTGLKGMKYCLAVSPDNEELLNILNEGLLRLKEKGIYDQIYNKWFYSATITTEQGYWILGVFLFLIVSVAFVLLHFSLKIRRNAKALQHVNESLSVSLQKYNAIFDSMLVGVEFYDKDGVLVDMNLKAMEIYGAPKGYSKADILALKISCFTNPNISELDVRHILSGNPYEGVLKYDYDMANKSGYYKTIYTGIREFDVKISPIFSENQELQGFIVLLSDITKVNSYRRELEESKLKTQLAIGISNMVQWEYDVEKRIFYTVNERWISNVLTAEDYYQVTHPDDLQKVKEVLHQMDMKRNEVFQFDVRFKFPTDKEWQYITINGTPLKQEGHDEITKFTGFQRNNTEWHFLTEELKISRNEAISTNQLLTAILDCLPGALFIKDPDDDFKYIMANKILCETLGKTESEIIGKTDFEIMTHEQATLYREEDEKVMTLTTPLITEREMNFGGRPFIWQTIKTSFTYMNNRRLIIIMSMDISALRKANTELRKAMIKAEESDKLKSAFLANMSHEIRTPLNAIVGFSELLKNCTDESEKEEYSNIIATNNELLLRLINDILDLSKLESGIVQLHNTEFDLSEHFNELSVTVRQRITNADIEFIAINPYAYCFVNTDRERLTQVGMNYLTNAIKYTVSGYIKMGYEYVNGGIKLYVEDSGIGIPDNKKDKIFQRFEKLDSFAQGTGLGLSICKAIIELEGGMVGFESTEGKGSYFWAWIPMQAKIAKIVDNED